ncbi:hypothetical protein [Paenibacillus apiarius]|uniref:Uncharacterized protein n=1 Tax=Paenibacillus apiarius TaxID=46240 RepID=A0ABT4DQR2_9BACL|nr:hypothetical protein [Paenibacillus apiarius]MCY9513331.1 hypothetical protein [Paenibacillus apiarius]MCY9519697.1 hypothetical protein [Paenibacillus apiarius]MCY9553247.1 hypothetical protein [Paenibacillus apiarius]MCY9557097.1 hypothetical protein [Paenibacillus apiarius]MCY9682162.1 hypothetical protein [Paenibacillus apiarius]
MGHVERIQLEKDLESAKRQARQAAYYVRKVNQLGALRFDYIRGRTERKPPENRSERLEMYKAELARRLEAARK